MRIAKLLYIFYICTSIVSLNLIHEAYIISNCMHIPNEFKNRFLFWFVCKRLCFSLFRNNIFISLAHDAAFPLNLGFFAHHTRTETIWQSEIVTTASAEGYVLWQFDL